MSTQPKNYYIFFNEKVFNLNDLGPIADMSMSDGLQAIVDKGLLGEEFKGCKWYDIMKNISLESPPDKDNTLLTALYAKVDAAFQHFKDLDSQGKPVEAARKVLESARKEYIAAKKLSTS